jgi:hypothetical protein
MKSLVNVAPTQLFHSIVRIRDYMAEQMDSSLSEYQKINTTELDQFLEGVKRGDPEFRVLSDRTALEAARTRLHNPNNTSTIIQQAGIKLGIIEETVRTHEDEIPGYFSASQRLDEILQTIQEQTASSPKEQQKRISLLLAEKRKTILTKEEPQIW